MVENFTQLDCWKLADELFDMILEDIEKFPNKKVGWVISDQTIRSISSISANIAEGIGHGSKKVLINHLRIARGSLTESQNWIIKIFKRQWITKKRFQVYMEKLSRERKMINSFIGSVRRRSD